MLFVKVTQVNTVYLCNTILVTEIFCYRYSAIILVKNNIFNEIWQWFQEFIGD